MAHIFTEELYKPNRRILLNVQFLGPYWIHVWAILKSQFTIWASCPQFMDNFSVIPEQFFFFSNFQSVAPEIHFSFKSFASCFKSHCLLFGEPITDI